MVPLHVGCRFLLVYYSNDLHVTAINKNYGKRSIKHKSSILWNKLPNALKGCLSIKSFNKRLKAFLQGFLCVYVYEFVILYLCV